MQRNRNIYLLKIYLSEIKVQNVLSIVQLVTSKKFVSKKKFVPQSKISAGFF